MRPTTASIVRCNMNAPPRPLPLFLELVREVSARTTRAGARCARRACARIETAPRRDRPPPKPEIARVARRMRCAITAATGRRRCLVPSLINPPRILDLDDEVSLTAAIARMGRRVLLLDWGKREQRSELSVAGHVEELLLPLLRSIGEPVGADRLLPRRDDGDRGRQSRAVRARRHARRAVEFRALSRKRRAARCRTCGAIRKPRPRTRRAADGSAAGGLLVARSRAHGAASSPNSAASIPTAPTRGRFVELEEWANEGEPCPIRPRRELIEDLFGAGSVRARQLAGRRPADHRRARRADPPPDRRRATASRRPQTAPPGDASASPPAMSE